MELISQFKKYIGEKGLFHQQDRLLVAVSGGVDSVVLCSLLYQCGYSFAIAHVNFSLRGGESDRDELFVKELATKYGVVDHSKKVDTNSYAVNHQCSIQEAARAIRYNWFDELMKEHGYRWLLTAHHLDDNIETALFHFLRGTGISGLRGMKPKQGNIVRPILFATREHILAFAASNQLAWVEDSSNQKTDYTRNAIRHKILPQIAEAIPSVYDNLANNLQRFEETETIFQEAIHRYKKDLVEEKGKEWHIPVLKLKRIKPLTTVLFEIVQPFGFHAKQVTDIISLLDSETGRYVDSSTHRIFRNRKWIVIAPLVTNESALILIDAPLTTTFEQGSIEFSTEAIVKAFDKSDNHQVQLDAKHIQFPLLLRKWKAGDYFYPLGMKKKKKLARFFIDNKLSKTEKEKVWVLEMNQKIIWVIGHRIDDRFKIGPGTITILTISLQNPV